MPTIHTPIRMDGHDYDMTVEFSLTVSGANWDLADVTVSHEGVTVTDKVDPETLQFIAVHAVENYLRKLN